MWQHRCFRQQAERIGRSAIDVIRPLRADERVAAQGHGPRRRARERGAVAPGPEHRSPHRRAPQDLCDPPWVATDQVEEAAGTGALGQSGGLRVSALQHRQLLELNTELAKPGLGVCDRLIRLLACGCGRNDKGRAGTRRGCEHAVLLLVAGVELITPDKGEHS